MSNTASPRWPFPAHDAFAQLDEENRLPLIQTLPGMITWPALLFALAFIFHSFAIAGLHLLAPRFEAHIFTTVIFAASSVAYTLLGVIMWARFDRYGASGPAFTILPVRPGEWLTAFLALAFVIVIGGRLSVMFHDYAMLDPTLTISGGAQMEEVSNIDDILGQGAPVWSLVLLTIIIAPIVEEVLFRGWMLPMMVARGVPTVFAILISALAFGLIHIQQGLLVITTTFFLGLALGAARMITGRVAAPVLGHMANNAWALFMVPYISRLQGA